MSFTIKGTKNKKKSAYKSIYIAEDLIDRIMEIAKAHETSFNNVVVSMIESCLREDEQPQTESEK